MMYSEFVSGTGCNDNAHNYKVFKNLEVMYMNSDMSKQEVYEYGKKLVDNSKSEEILKLEAELKAKIAESKERIVDCKREIAYRESMIQIWLEDDNEEMAKSDKNYIAYLKNEIKSERRKIAGCKWVLQG